MMPCSNSRRAATTWTMGTASPSAQGQVMNRTATAMVSARCQSPVASTHPRKLSSAALWTPVAQRCAARSEIGRAKCRDRVCTDVESLVDDISFNKESITHSKLNHMLLYYKTI